MALLWSASRRARAVHARRPERAADANADGNGRADAGPLADIPGAQTCLEYLDQYSHTRSGTYKLYPRGRHGEAFEGTAT